MTNYVTLIQENCETISIDTVIAKILADDLPGVAEEARNYFDIESRAGREVIIAIDHNGLLYEFLYTDIDVKDDLRRYVNENDSLPNFLRKKFCRVV